MEASPDDPTTKAATYYPCFHCFPERLRAAVDADQMQRAQTRRTGLLDSAHIAPRFRRTTLDNYEVYATGEHRKLQQAALEACKEYARRVCEEPGFGAWLTLLGNSGTGKNHLACGILHKAMEAGRTILSVSLIELIERTKSAFGTGEDREKILDGPRKADLLFLDDLGVGYGTLHEQVNVYRVLNYRYDYDLPTILTTNLPLKWKKGMPENVQTIASIYSDRIASRLEDRPNGNVLIQCTWPSYRARKDVKK